MSTQGSQLNFKGQNIYVGMDIHKKQFTVSIAGEHLAYKTFSQPPKPEILSDYLKRSYPSANYFAVYEAGFSGYWIQESLSQLGISCIVVNPCDVPTSDKEKKQKRDCVDSRKLVRSLRNGELKGIYVPEKVIQQDRSLLRVRQRIIGNQTRCRNRIKSLLYFFGIEFPEKFEKSGTHWSKRFIEWLGSLDLGGSGNVSLSLLLREASFHRDTLLSVEKQLLSLIKEPRYHEDYNLLISVPGIGRLTALTLLSEMSNIRRFKSRDEMCAYIGLIPNVYASGEKEKVGEITKRGNKHLKQLIIESAWTAARTDPAMSLKYHQLTSRMAGNKAIIRIARKLVNRIRYVLINKRPYQFALAA